MAKAKTPDKAERVIALIGGESGAGKSFFIANLKNALIFDTDIGGGLTYAKERIERNGSQLIQVGSYLEVMEYIRKNRSKLNEYTTLAIDHLSTLQQEAVLRHNPAMDRDFGSSADKGAKEWRKIRELIRNMDFNLICTAHVKGKWEKEKVVGITTDASKNIEGDFTIVLYLTKVGKPTKANPSMANVQKWRRDPEDVRGEVPETFPFTMDKFLEIHGFGMDGKREETPMATPEQIAEANRLLSVVKLPDGALEKWLSKAKADTIADATEEAVLKLIAYLHGLMKQPELGAA